ncbi:HD domain-containing phosphohydrolase [Sulfurimonas sp.]|uniref:HD domain-containing phosphohydrolase n=1 Tax=Sulfurimonas sp. TaxID=2022749 RepID=UPI0026395872|nr:HD domain-containing phosphohydrolase [Sulfurimonas sp.]
MNYIKQLKTLAQTLNVLYVEDDAPIRKEMMAYLENFFLKVVVAKNGKEGLEAYTKEDFDIVVSDLSMPVMNGIDMIAKIRKINNEQAILITTAHSESDYMISAIKLGVDGYVLKPFDFEQLNYELFKISEKLHTFKENEEYKQSLQRMVEQKTSELSTMIHFQKQNYEKTLLAMVTMIEERDTYTAGHSERVATYSKMIAKEMHYSDVACEKVYKAGILHDIGKVATPDVVLLKPQKLNDLEYKLIQEHAEVGYRLLVGIPMFKELADIVRDHHERCDGSGYPRGIRSKEINEFAKVMMVADTFDAMTTNRIYKGRKSVQDALEEIGSLKGIQFNVKVVEAALVALADIKLDDGINQLPNTALEKERFAYFYKDRLTDLYNQSYFDVKIVQNNYDCTYTKLHMFMMKNFSRYNKESGWNAGDLTLTKVALYVKEHCLSDMVFRIFGDDFLVLDNGACRCEEIKLGIDTILKDTIASCEMQSIDLSLHHIKSSKELEKLLLS